MVENYFYGKVGCNSLIWKNIEKETPTFINQFSLHSFKNILKYMQFLTSQIIISLNTLLLDNSK